MALSNQWQSAGDQPLMEPRTLRAALVDEIECGLIVCDERGEIRFANRAAQPELARGTALRRVGDCLQRAPGPGPDFEAALRLAARHGKRSLLRLGAGSDRLLVSVQPLRTAEGTFGLVVLGRRRACSDLGIEMLAVCCGLTLAERRVLSALVRALPPRQIASECSVALSTVRTHISSIRAKLEARSIDGLLLRVAEVPPVSGPLGAGAQALPLAA